MYISNNKERTDLAYTSNAQIYLNVLIEHCYYALKVHVYEPSVILSPR